MFTFHGRNYFTMDYNCSSKVAAVGVQLSRGAESAPRIPTRGSFPVKVTALLAQR